MLIKYLSESLKSFLCSIRVSDWTVAIEYSGINRAPNTAQDLETNTCQEWRQPPVLLQPKPKVPYMAEKTQWQKDGAKPVWRKFTRVSPPGLFPCLFHSHGQSDQGRPGVTSPAAGGEAAASLHSQPSDWHCHQTNWLLWTKTRNLQPAKGFWSRFPAVNSRHHLAEVTHHLLLKAATWTYFKDFKRLLSSSSQVGSVVSSRDSCWNQDCLQMVDPLN